MGSKLERSSEERGDRSSQTVNDSGDQARPAPGRQGFVNVNEAGPSLRRHGKTTCLRVNYMKSDTVKQLVVQE